MRKKMLAAAAASVILAATAGCGGSDSDNGATESPTAASSNTPAASDEPSPSESSQETEPAGVTYFDSQVTPDAGVAPGTNLTVKATDAMPSTSYYCLIAAFSTEQEGVSAPLESSLTPVSSKANGKLTCNVTYEPFSAKDNNGDVRHCPTTNADRSAGFQCGVVLADAATVGAMSASAVAFTPVG